MLTSIMEVVRPKFIIGKCWMKQYLENTLWQLQLTPGPVASTIHIFAQHAFC